MDSIKVVVATWTLVSFVDCCVAVVAMSIRERYDIRHNCAGMVWVLDGCLWIFFLRGGYNMVSRDG
ncbi:hypothetical protein HOY80DRAFT_954038 [Tuber brumale]|nr:hypothetical protein HOY80DRAFT_954038 [Tuber brumale]